MLLSILCDPLPLQPPPEKQCSEPWGVTGGLKQESDMKAASLGPLFGLGEQNRLGRGKMGKGAL